MIFTNINKTDFFLKSVFYSYKEIYTNQNYNGKIITEFKLSKGEPCAKSSEINWHEYYQNEVEGYYGCKTSIDGSATSTRYTKVNEAGINTVIYETIIQR